MPKSSTRRSPRWALGLLSAVFTLMIIGGLATYFSPWPGTLAMRWMAEGSADSVSATLSELAPSGVETRTDVTYRDGDPDALLDVYFPDSALAALPTLIWTHGGSWIYGDKEDYSGYYKSLAGQGFTVISLDYSLGPDATYPTVLHQLNDAYRYITDNAEQLHVDPNALFLGGDSAGGQISSQIAAMITDPVYAAEVGVTPSLSPQQVRGVVLDCGVFDMYEFLDPDGRFGWTADRESVWAYTGTKDFENSPAVRQMSTINIVTSAFPPTFITGGNADELTAGQSKPFADRLLRLGVDVDALFYPDDYEPALEHEYQFDLDTPDGQIAFDRTVAFLRAHSQ
ncbi:MULTISPECIES: alpha/beta hydrolase [unclassified Rhodococcus (in: high G+C Gram-positive bacteria)]|uniref:alpha/beta hydrolase n=1 Tax=unclassified Rhodococcus (in: high G+C Gram-positive bacteria) TaxID=192944 RepID=UPI0005D372A8|nr:MULTISPECIES: alpha/beta hydrolase [unclassified Rhodococcus (in: high G+C Gram-positive bacteria)]KJF23213.1 Lipase 2 [Rhodococcus sp. AD45]